MTVRVVQAKWSKKQMLALPEWEGQRDTDKRVAKYLARKDFDATNATIKTGWATVVVGGEESRINGNTRAHVMNHMPLDEAEMTVRRKDFAKHFPEEVLGDKYICSTKEEAQEMYNSIDNTSSSKGAADKLTSAFKACGVGVRSKMYRSGRGTSGLALAWRALLGQASNSACWRTETMVTEFIHELRLLDKLMSDNNVPANSRVVSYPGFQMAVLLTLYRARLTPHKRGDGESVDEVYKFWDTVIKYEGEIIVAGSDLVSKSPVIKMWTMVNDDVLAASDDKTQSRETWYEVGAKALSLFLRRREASVDRPSHKKVVIETFFPCLVEAQAEAA
jgi:hypothetical protein